MRTKCLEEQGIQQCRPNLKQKVDPPPLSKPLGLGSGTERSTPRGLMSASACGGGVQSISADH